MFKRSKSYDRRYSSVVSIDKIMVEEDSKAINSYIPSKNTSLTDTLIDSIGEDDFFKYEGGNNIMSDDIDLLGCIENTPKNTIGVEQDKVTESESGGESFPLIVWLLLGVVITIVLTVVI